MSLASNNKFTEVFQAVVSALHSLHHIRDRMRRSYSYIAIGHALRVHVPVVVFQ